MPKNDQLPAMLFYVDDFASDGVVEAMSTEQVGAYCLILCKAWRENPAGTIPDNDEVLARWARLTAKRWIACRDGVLRAFYIGDDGRWHQKRMKLEFQKALDREEKKTARGKKGADARWNTQAMPKHDPSINQAMLKNANQTQTKPNCNGQTQTKALPSEGSQFEFDQQNVEKADWQTTFDDFSRRLEPTNEDRRVVAQFAWLVCAGAPIRPAIHDALDGITAMRRQGQPPKSPVAYLRGCLSDSIGGNRITDLLNKAPKRRECDVIVGGA